MVGEAIPSKYCDRVYLIMFLLFIICGMKQLKYDASSIEGDYPRVDSCSDGKCGCGLLVAKRVCGCCLIEPAPLVASELAQHGTISVHSEFRYYREFNRELPCESQDGNRSFP